VAKPTKVSGLYASGIGEPFRGDSDGGVAISEGELYIDDQVFAAVSVNDSDNPFQDLGVTEFAVFQNPEDPAFRRVVRERIVDQFAFLESNNLARLLRVTFAQSSSPSGDYECSVTYIALETNSERESTFQMTREGDNGLRPIR
jgi:hypothetical protein